MTDKCALWGTDVEVYPRGEYYIVNSPRSGGEYQVVKGSFIGQTGTDNLDIDCKAKITSWLVSQRIRGDPTPELNEEIISAAKNKRRLPLTERIDRYLLCFDKFSPKLGQHMEESGSQELLLFAWTESVDRVEFNTLMRYISGRKLAHQNWVRGPYQLTNKGYARLEKIQNSEVNSTQAFVAMWFNLAMDDAYKFGLQVGIKNAGYQALRIDTVEHNNKIDDQIIAEIRRSRFVVADFTCELASIKTSNGSDRNDAIARGGVYYEAGFAQGLGIPVIWTCREDCINFAHFDTRQFNHITWKTPAELATKLTNRICAILGQGPIKNNP